MDGFWEMCTLAIDAHCFLNWRHGINEAPGWNFIGFKETGRSRVHRNVLNSDANREDASSSACNVGMCTELVNVPTLRMTLTAAYETEIRKTVLLYIDRHAYSPLSLSLWTWMTKTQENDKSKDLLHHLWSPIPHLRIREMKPKLAFREYEYHQTVQDIKKWWLDPTLSWPWSWSWCQ